jgi:hypothetical protein
VSEPVLVDPAGGMPEFDGIEADFVGDDLSPVGPGFDFLGRRAGSMGIGGEGFEGADAVVYEVAATGQRDPGVAGSDHVGAGVKCEEEHSETANNSCTFSEGGFILLGQIGHNFPSHHQAAVFEIKGFLRFFRDAIRFDSES